MGPLDAVQLAPLMDLTSGRPEIVIALIDGPVALNLPDFIGAKIREIPGKLRGTCDRAGALACLHGTFVAGMLAARRGSPAPAISPGCTLLLRPIFADSSSGQGDMPSATPEALADAITDSVKAGARLINLSSALLRSSPEGDRMTEEALNYAASRGVITIAAAGNQGTVGSSSITRHPWVIPVAACNVSGQILSQSNLARSIGHRGLCAPGEGVTSLGADGKPQTLGGTSAAAPFVTGAIALIWSEFPSARANEIKLAITHSSRPRRPALAPPLLNAWAAYQAMASASAGRVA
jgi:subtilisin family serine protease